ncbi:unnamed protein product, partial [Polarella glacialis]
MHWVHDLPAHPDQAAGSPQKAYLAVAPHMEKLRGEIQAFCPDCIVAACQGGAYLVGLWQAGQWRGPSVMINAHPSLPRQLPRDVPIVIAHGSNDEAYPWARGRLEELAATASPNKCLLYYTADSGQTSSGNRTRIGDRHLMQSLQMHDCLPKLIDAAVSTDGPEVHLVQASWREQLGAARAESEHWMGLSLERLRRLWVSPGHLGADEQKLFDVPRMSEELLGSKAYLLSPQSNWERVPILRIERVENGLHMEGSALPYRDALRRSLGEQGVEFEPGSHTSWAFHGTDYDALQSIARDGFQPLASGTRNSPVWGCGTCLARDAKYVADGQFCPRRPDGSRCMLLCLLTTGLPCLGDPAHKGCLPFRQKPHRYNSSVDSLACPEIYILQNPGAAYPAYLITFA